MGDMMWRGPTLNINKINPGVLFIFVKYNFGLNRVFMQK